MNNFLIGTSGYDYPEWKGVFYPADIKRADFLAYYASVFNALELNNTFYNMPTAERIFSFYERSEGRLQFSIKANRLLTHEIDQNWQTVAKDFKNAIKPVQEKDKLCSVLFQFPQSFHYTPDNRIYLSKLIQEFDGFPVVIEFRHREWIRDSVFEGLEKMNASFAFCDMPELKYLPAGLLKEIDEKHAAGQQFYVRLHGRNEGSWYAADEKFVSNVQIDSSTRYDYNYTDEELQNFIPIFEPVILKDRKVVVFFNNHPKGSGALNAVSLKNMMESHHIAK